MRIFGSTAVVVSEDVFEARDAAVVHVGGGVGDAAQAGRAEFAAVGLVSCNFEAAEIERRRAPAHAGIVKLLVAEVGPVVAAPAAGLALPEPEAVPLLWSQSGRVPARAKTVDAAVAQEQRALKARQSLGERIRARGFAERLLKSGRIFCVRPQALDRFGDGAAQLMGILDRLERLRLQRRRPAVPEQAGSVTPAPPPRGVTPAFVAVHADRDSLFVREAVRGVVAARAGEGAIRRQNRIEEQRSPQPGARFGQGAVFWRLRGARQAEGNVSDVDFEGET